MDGEQWAVYCGGCSLTWTVPYRHPGKTICDGCVKRLQALRQQDGMVTVPREPTEAMIKAGCTESISWDVHLNPNDVKDLYRAMLAASGQDQRGAAATAGGQRPEEAVAGCEQVSLPLAESRSGMQSAPHSSPDLLRGICLGIEAAAQECDAIGWPQELLASRIRKLTPESIAAKAAEKKG